MKVFNHKSEVENRKMKMLNAIYLIFVSFLAIQIYAWSQLVGPVVSLAGNVFNDVTRQPVTVFLVVFDKDGNRVNATRSNAADNGYYYIAGLKPGNKYKISVKQKQFFNEEFDIVVPNTNKYLEISHDFLVKPLEKNAQLKLAVPPFELNKSKLRYGAELFLDDYAQTLQLNPDVKFTITCYPDNNDNQAENLNLTQERANALKSYFVTNGLDAGRINVKGFDKTDPLMPPPTKKSAKGKRYIGSSYIVVDEF